MWSTVGRDKGWIILPFLPNVISVNKSKHFCKNLYQSNEAISLEFISHNFNKNFKLMYLVRFKLVQASYILWVVILNGPSSIWVIVLFAGRWKNPREANLTGSMSILNFVHNLYCRYAVFLSCLLFTDFGHYKFYVDYFWLRVHSLIVSTKLVVRLLWFTICIFIVMVNL